MANDMKDGVKSSANNGGNIRVCGDSTTDRGRHHLSQGGEKVGEVITSKSKK
jgi:hypothetical protein